MIRWMMVAALGAALAGCEAERASDTDANAADAATEPATAAENRRSQSLAARLAAQAAQEVGAFDFFEVATVDEMRNLAAKRFPAGMPREDVRRALIEEGGARLFEHPEDDGVEKYVFDINLCRLHVFRWNLSADYGPDGALEQFYVNGLHTIPGGGDITRTRAKPDKDGTVHKLVSIMPRPEADLGDKAIQFEGYDYDGDGATTLDQSVVVFGPSRADPHDFGRRYRYANVERWRSIVDGFTLEDVREWPGACPTAPADADEGRADG